MRSRPLILVVDDDAATREYLATVLRFGGFEVESAGDGASALRHVEQRRPDAILLDLDLPRMNGFAVHTALQHDERSRGLPIVIATGTGWRSPSPVAATIRKPIRPDELVKVMFDALTRSEEPSHIAAHSERTILWVCPRCRRVIRETHELGHPLTSEMRPDITPCPECSATSLKDGQDV